MTARTLISANWKMNLNHLEAIRLLQELSFLLEDINFEKIEISIHPPHTSLRSVQVLIDDMKKLQLELGAQNCHFEDSGAYTGEISPVMLAALHVKYVILGHSERREHFWETDEAIAKKLEAAWRNNLTPILAVGETLEEKEEGKTEEKINTQLEIALASARPKDVGEMVIAYEPIWAIGTGHSAGSEDIKLAQELIRAWIKSNKNSVAAKSVRIQYGGSVKPINTAEILSVDGIDGLLVGGASLSSQDFTRIVRAADEA